MLDECEQNEKDILMPEYSASDDESTKMNELTFPSLLINAIKELHGLVRSKTKLSKQFMFGSVFLNDCYAGRMLCIVFIVQGTCGLFVFFVHVWTIASEYVCF